MLGVLLLLIGWLVGLVILYKVGVVVLGVALYALGAIGHSVGGRSHWF